MRSCSSRSLRRTWAATSSPSRPGPIELDLRLEAVIEGVLVTGSGRGGPSASACAACARCARRSRSSSRSCSSTRSRRERGPRTATTRTSVRELDGDLLDLEPTVADAMVPALPFQPLCSPDCGGLCSVCGVRLADAAGHSHEVLDPRWAALSALGGSTRRKRASRGCSEAQDVAQQHPCASVAVEDDCHDAPRRARSARPTRCRTRRARRAVPTRTVPYAEAVRTEFEVR